MVDTHYGTTCFPVNASDVNFYNMDRIRAAQLRSLFTELAWLMCMHRVIPLAITVLKGVFFKGLLKLRLPIVVTVTVRGNGPMSACVFLNMQVPSAL